jgi:hypothetical protein
MTHCLSTPLHLIQSPTKGATLGKHTLSRHAGVRKKAALPKESGLTINPSRANNLSLPEQLLVQLVFEPFLAAAAGCGLAELAQHELL